MTRAADLPPERASNGRIAAVGLVLLAALTALVFTGARWNHRLQSAWFDTCQIAMPRAIVSMPVTVVEIDEKSLARLGQWPWPRTVLAELIGAIRRHSPAAIGVDILMPEPDRLSPERLLARARERDPVLAARLDALPPSDRELARAIAGGPVVLGLAATTERGGRTPRSPPFRIVERPGREPATRDLASNLPRYAGALANIEELEAAATGHGAISIGASDIVVRRVPLAVRIDDQIVPAMAIELLRVAIGAPEVRLHVDGPAIEAIAVGDFVVPTEPDGALRLHYSARDARRSVSAIDVLDGSVDTERLAHKLVLVGTTGLALVDYQGTPLAERMPGTEIQAQLLENLYDQSWLARPSWAPLAEVALFALLGLALIGSTPRLRPGHGALVAAGCIALPLVAGFAAFATRRLVFDGAGPALALLLLYVVLLVLTLAKAARQRRLLERAVQWQREEAARVAGEFDAARRIQLGFLPRADALRGDRRIDLAAAMTPAREVGGDLYDFFMLDARRLFFLVGDVAGKGLSASVFMAVSKALCKSARLRMPDATIGEWMRAANDEISRDNPEMLFVTAFAGALDLETGVLSYGNAGHENPYVVNRAERDLARLADGGGPPLCTVERFDYRDAARTLRPGELVCIVTDGVVEAQDRAGQRYGRARLDLALARWRDGPAAAAALVDALMADVQAFAAGAEPADDVTVLALRWVGPGAA